MKRDEYRYVTIQDDIIIDGNIMTKRPETSEDTAVHTKRVIRGEDICFLEEGRCERAAMIGRSASAVQIAKTLSASVISSISSDISDLFVKPFVSNEIEPRPLAKYEGVLLRNEYLDSVYKSGLFVERRDAPVHSRSLVLSEIADIFGELADLSAIADLDMSRSRIDGSISTTYSMSGRTYSDAIPSEDITRYAAFSRASLYTKYNGQWQSDIKDLSHTGSFAVRPRDGWEVKGCLLGSVFTEGIDDYARTIYTDGKFVSASNGAVELTASNYDQLLSRIDDVGFAGYNNIQRVIERCAEHPGASRYQSSYGYFILPIVFPSDFRTKL